MQVPWERSTNLKNQFVLTVIFLIGEQLGLVGGAMLWCTQVMNTWPNSTSGNVRQLTTLTERQRQVATLACQGLSNREIAKKLGVVEGTVKIHLNVIYEKLNVRSRTDLIIRFGTSWRVAV